MPDEMPASLLGSGVPREAVEAAARVEFDLTYDGDRSWDEAPEVLREDYRADVLPGLAAAVPVLLEAAEANYRYYRSVIQQITDVANGNANRLVSAIAEVAALTAQRDAALAIHAPTYDSCADETWRVNARCGECGWSYPCPTVAALAGASPVAADPPTEGESHG